MIMNEGWDPGEEEIVDELVEAANAAIFDAVGRSVPFASVDLARIEYFAGLDDGALYVYCLFMLWIEGWKNVLARVVPDIDGDGYWRFANSEILAETEGVSDSAGNAVRLLLCHAIDHVDDDDDDSSFADFRLQIFDGGVGRRRECAIVLLFMVKSAFIELAQTGQLSSGEIRRDPRF